MTKLTQQTRVEPALQINLNLVFFGFLGLIFIILFAIIGRGLFFKPESFLALMLIAGTFAFVLGDVVIKGKTDFFRVPMDYFVVALGLIYVLAITVAASTPDAILGAWRNLGYVLVFFITTQLIRSWKSYWLLVELLFASGVLVGIIGLFAAMGMFNYPGAYEGKAILSTLQYQNALAIFLAMMTLLGFGLWARSDKDPLREIGYLAGLLIMNVALLGTQSRAVWILLPGLLLAWVVPLGKEIRSRMFLAICYVLITGMLISRVFFSLVDSSELAAATTLLSGGVIFSLSGWLILHRINRYISRKPMSPAIRKFWQGVGIAYLVATLLIYGIYAVKTLPGGWAAVMPADLTQQMQTVNSSDRSFATRFVFYRDALEIAKDYPLLGTGAGGWKALYPQYRTLPYTTSEVHNAYLQTLVETGLIGFLIYLALWGTGIYSAYRLFKHFRKDVKWPLVWSVIMALGAMALHSFIDFDLSLPTLSIVTWILLALLRNARQMAKKSTEAFEVTGVRRWLVLVAGLTLALVVFMPAYRLYQAGQAGAEGARAMAAGDLPKAESQLRQAMSLDPYTGSFVADLARINLVHWLQDNDQERRQQGLQMAEAAIKKEPHNIQLKSSLITAYLITGMTDQGINTARQLIKANPYELKAYEVFAGAGVEGAMYYQQQGQPSQMLLCLDGVLDIPTWLEDARKAVAKHSGQAYRYITFLEPSPQLNLSLGQANLLMGSTLEGIPYLELAVKDKKLGKEAGAWLTMAYQKAGEQDKSDRLKKRWTQQDQGFEAMLEQVQKILNK